jgi:flagellar biosynthesis anti-sigma factor FlgM
MIISSHEVDLVREAGLNGAPGAAVPAPLRSSVAEDAALVMEAKQAIKAMPEVREELVAAIRARIENGSYQVSGDVIADVMVRRAYADRIR